MWQLRRRWEPVLITDLLAAGLGSEDKETRGGLESSPAVLGESGHRVSRVTL